MAVVCEADDPAALQTALATYAGSAFQADWVAVMAGDGVLASYGNPPADSYLIALARGASSSRPVVPGLAGPDDLAAAPLATRGARSCSSGGRGTSSGSGNGPSCWPWPASPTTSGVASMPRPILPARHPVGATAG